MIYEVYCIVKMLFMLFKMLQSKDNILAISNVVNVYTIRLQKRKISTQKKKITNILITIGFIIKFRENMPFDIGKKCVLFFIQSKFRPRGYKTFSVLNSAEQGINPAYKC